MASEGPAEFRRARTPEQVEVRRRTILEAAAHLLDEMSLSEISLRELSRRVGLSKTNVVRYFETREAVYFELLIREFDLWLAELPAELDAAAPRSPDDVVDLWARSVAGRRALCELISSLGTELERNLSADAVREFKLANRALQIRLADLLMQWVPSLTRSGAGELVAMSYLLIAGLWPFANPSPAVAEAVLDPRLAHSRVDFPARLSRALRVCLAGLLRLPDEEVTVPEG